MDAVVRGQVSFRRALSRKLVFYDLLTERSDTQHEAAGPGKKEAWVELLVKAAHGDEEGGLSVERVRDIRDTIKLGDVVQAWGQVEGAHAIPTFIVHKIEVIRRWRDQPVAAWGKLPSAFVPRPAPRGPHVPHQPLSHGPLRSSGDLGPPSADSPAAAPQGEAGVLATTCSLARTETRSACGETALVGDGHAAGGGTFSGSRPKGHGREAMPAEAGLCKYWASTGRCPKGAACRYAHPAYRCGAEGVQQSFVRGRRAERQGAAAAQGFVHGAADAAKRRRAAVLCRWLLAAYGREYLNSGSGVVDVAGGRGALTFELLVCCGVRCTLLEPRPAKLSRRQLREVADRRLGAGAGEARAARGFALPQVRACLTPDTWQPAVEWQRRQNEEQQQQQQQQQGAGGVGEAPGGLCAADTCGLSTAAGSTGAECGGVPHAAELLANCSLLVGLHPDQATDAILDAALALGKPFAVVPCCVFARLFPHRTLYLPRDEVGDTEGGGVSACDPAASPHVAVRVESYPALVRHLLQRGAQGSGVGAGELPAGSSWWAEWHGTGHRGGAGVGPARADGGEDSGTGSDGEEEVGRGQEGDHGAGSGSPITAPGRLEDPLPAVSALRLLDDAAVVWGREEKQQQCQELVQQQQEHEHRRHGDMAPMESHRFPGDIGPSAVHEARSHAVKHGAGPLRGGAGVHISNGWLSGRMLQQSCLAAEDERGGSLPAVPAEHAAAGACAEPGGVRWCVGLTRLGFEGANQLVFRLRA